MTIHRSSDKTRFVRIDNAVVDDRALTFRARGVMAHLLAKPIDWEISADRLAAESPSEGRDAMRAVIRELEGLGYIVRRKPRDASGKVRSVLDLYECPGRTDDGISGAGRTTRTKKAQVTPTTGKPTVGQPDVGEPAAGEPDVGGPGVITNDGPQTTVTNEELLPEPAAPVVRERSAEVVPMRPRNELMDALVAACGLDQAKMTDRAKKAAAVASNELRKIGVTPDDVHAVIPSRWPPTWTLTPSAVANQWATVQARRPTNQQPKLSRSSEALRRIAERDRAAGRL